MRDEEDALAQAGALAAQGSRDRPLYGIPVAVKDNIDVAGLRTTAACAAFAYAPGKDATCVARLQAEGAIVVGKTNLDQFATGLAGVRSPYGIPRNPFKEALVPGGSSSGSAVAVAAGLVPLPPPAPTPPVRARTGRAQQHCRPQAEPRPRLECRVVPACRTLDCVSVLALTVEDAFTALSALAGPDDADPYSRPRALDALGPRPDGVRLGVPMAGQREFDGDAHSAAAYDAVLLVFSTLGAQIVEIDMEPFYRTARLLYEGPWVAERYIAARSVIETAPQSMHPITRQIILNGARYSAADAFAAFYQLQELRRACERAFARIDALALPTIPRAYTVDEMLVDPIELNSRLGTYTNFVNLLDLCALSVPAAILPGGIPFGVTLIGRAGEDAALAAIGRLFHAETELPMGATGKMQPVLGAER